MFTFQGAHSGEQQGCQRLQEGRPSCEGAMLAGLQVEADQQGKVYEDDGEVPRDLG